MIISGKNSIFEALKSEKTINKILISKSENNDFSHKIVEMCRNKKLRFDFVDKVVLDKMAIHNQGYVADITDYNYYNLEDIIDENKEDKFIFILDGVEDPHNFGSIIRVAECVGVDGIIIENRRSCNVNETVYKTSCGAINHTKIVKVGNINDTIKTLQKNNIWVFVAEAGGESVFKTNLKGNIAIVFGSEGNGVGQLTKKICDGIISLPMKGKVNSLNVSTSSSAIAYEVLRQRGL